MRVAAFDVGIVNLVYAVVETAAQPHDFRIIHWKKIGVGKASESCDVLVAALNLAIQANMNDFSGVDVFVIERQMTIKMCVLAHSIQTHFILCGGGARVLIQHATRKNQCGTWLTYHGAPSSATDQADYRTYKKRAVLDAAQCLLIQEDKHWLVVYGNAPKQDDYADALLHAIWWLLVRK